MFRFEVEWNGYQYQVFRTEQHKIFRMPTSLVS